MRKWLVITKKEFNDNIQKKSFIAMTLLMPILIIGFPLLTSGLGDNLITLKVGVLDHSDGSFVAGLANYSGGIGLKIIKYDNPANLTNAVVAGDISVGMIVPESLASGNVTVYIDQTNVLSYSFPQVLKSYQDGLTKERVGQLLTGLNISNASAYLTPFSFETKTVSGEAAERPSVFSQMLPILIFISLIFGGQFMAESLAGERERKTIELLLSTPVSKRDILLGKILSITILIMAQVGLWFAAIFGVSAYTGQNLVNPFFLAQALVYFSVAVLMFCTLGVIISSFVSTMRDAQQYFGLAVVPFYIFAVLPLEILPDWVVRICTYFPIVSISIATRQTLVGKMSLFSLDGAIILLISFATLGALIYIGSKVFEKKVIGGL